jgi:hypothetical protein
MMWEGSNPHIQFMAANRARDRPYLAHPLPAEALSARSAPVVMNAEDPARYR